MTPGRPPLTFIFIFVLETSLHRVLCVIMILLLSTAHLPQPEEKIRRFTFNEENLRPAVSSVDTLYLQQFNTPDNKRTSACTELVHILLGDAHRWCGFTMEIINVSSHRRSANSSHRHVQSTMLPDDRFPNATFESDKSISQTTTTAQYVLPCDSVFVLVANSSTSIRLHQFTPHSTPVDFGNELCEEMNTCPVRDNTSNVDISSKDVHKYYTQIPGVSYCPEMEELNLEDCIRTLGILVVLLHLRKKKLEKIKSFLLSPKKPTIDNFIKSYKIDCNETEQSSRINLVKYFISRISRTRVKPESYRNLILSPCSSNDNTDLSCYVKCIDENAENIEDVPISKDLSRFWRLDFRQFSQPRRVYTVFPATVNSLMTSELGRLGTLASLPSSCTAYRIPLAKAGFYYDVNNTSRNPDNQHELVCFSCDITCSRWDTGESPAEIHRRLSPDCPHVKTLFPDSSGTFSSMSSGIGSSISSSYNSDVASEQSNSSLSPASSTSGSFHANSISSQSTVRAAGYDSSDLTTDCAAIAPSSHLPGSSVTQSSVTITSNGQGGYLDDRPTMSMDIAVYPQFSTSQSRLATFRSWPPTHFFDPRTLVSLGFFYAGYADCIRCFYCGVGLKSWEPGDDVTEEHVRWRPHCGFTLATRGRRFVENVLARIQSAESSGTEVVDSGPGRQEPSPPERNRLTPQASKSSPSYVRNASKSSPTRASRSPTHATDSTVTSPTQTNSVIVSSSSSSGAAESEAVSQPSVIFEKIREMGFPKDLVDLVLEEIEATGLPDVNMSVLVDRIVEMQQTSESDSRAGRPDIQTDGEDAYISEEVKRIRRLREENARLKARRLCRSCKTSMVGMIFLPCGHVVSCTECGAKTRHCTLCNELIRATANVFLC